jgi:dimethylglycine dehydrogenase
MVTNGVGLADMSVLSKFEVTGPEARAFVDALGCNTAPREGRIGLTYALSPAGGTEAEFTVAALPGDRFYITSAAAAEMRDDDLMRAHAGGFDVTVTRETEDWAVIALMGPKAAEVLRRVTDAPFGPWMSLREMTVAGIPLGRTGGPGDIAACALYLAQPGSYINGQVIAVDGGRHLGF